MSALHGGKRAGAGRPGISIDEKRLIALQKQGLSFRMMGLRFGVPVHVIAYRMTKIKRGLSSIIQLA